MVRRLSSGWSGHGAAAAGHAGAVGLVVLALYGCWFGVADRFAVFLYGHLGATPFDAETRSRYWMAGLVAAGIVLAGYGGANWCLGRVAALCRRGYRPPAWQRVWLLAAPLTAGGVVAITTTVNAPTLPLRDALFSALAALVGLALALPFGEWAASRPVETAWALVHGLGMVPVLGLGYAPERATAGWLTSTRLAWAVAAGALIVSALWLGLLSVLRWWRKVPGPHWIELLWVGFAWMYLLGPLAHHLLATPPSYRYISVAANFFSRRLVVQGAVWLVATALALGAA